MRDIWNPWHGCKKISEGCRNCYMYALDARRGVKTPSDEVFRTGQFDYPVRKDRHGRYKVLAGERIRVNMTSDTFLDEADGWRPEMWDIIRQRPDVVFWLLTKRPERIMDHLPPDWGNGWPNVMLNVTCENQEMFDRRWPIFEKVPACWKGMCLAPLIGPVDIGPALRSSQISEISAGGENYDNPRPCRYEWIEAVHDACKAYRVNFHWYESGTYLIKDGVRHEITSKADQAKIAGAAGLNLHYYDIGFVLCDPDDGRVLDESELYSRVYNTSHCAGCGNQHMCNGCDPKCRQHGPSDILLNKKDFLEYQKKIGIRCIPE